jgi:3-phosphoshikimate 1-carboxyvinyltransferase
MGRIIEPLTQMGAKIESAAGRLPIRFFGRQKLNAAEHHLQVASAQVKSCLLLAGLLAEGRTTIIERGSTRDHTERMLEWLDVDAHEGQTLSISGEQTLTARDIQVPGDISSAAFFLVAAACLNGSDLTIPNVGLNPTRSAIIGALKDVGVICEITNRRDVCNEQRGTIRVHGQIKEKAGDSPTILGADVISSIIDEIPILAVLGTQMNGGIEIRDAAELRHKETDRIAAVIENLGRMGARVEEFHDGFKVERSDLRAAALDSFGDHRIAMAFAIAGLIAEGATEIRDAECVDISFPGFFDTLSTVVR